MPLSPQPLPGSLTRALGRVLRGQMANRRTTLAEACVVMGVSEGQLSRMMHGKRRIDVEQLADLCNFLGVDMIDVLREARGESSAPPPHSLESEVRNTSLRELSRRVRVLVAYFTGDAYGAAARAVRRLDVDLSNAEWNDLVEGELARMPDARLLQSISAALGVDPGYLDSGDQEFVARIEAGLELADVMRQTGTSRVAARALTKLGADEIRAIADLIRSGQSGQVGA